MGIEYSALIGELDELCRVYNAFAVGIDGMECAGKTTLAAYLSKKYGAPVIHMDDFLLPENERPQGWQDTPGAEMDFERFCEEICEPWLHKKPIVYSIRDSKTGEYTERRALPDGQMFLIEGTYSMHPAVLDFYDLHLFMKVSNATQAARAAAAERPLPPDMLARHDRYFVTNMTELLCDEVLDEEFRIPEEEQTASQK